MEDNNFDKNISATNQDEIVCKNCSAKLVFAPGTTSLKCEYCGAENQIEISNEKIEELDFLSFLETQAGAAEKEEILTVKCDACGAETTFDNNIVSDSCAFCGNHLVVNDGTNCSIIKPKSLLPFAIDRKKAKDLFKGWINKLWFAPSALKKYARQFEKLAGMYIPFWTYDSDTSTYYTGQRGDNYTDTETYTNDKGETKTRTVTKTRWRSVSGNVNKFFDDVLVIASESLPKKYLKKLEPWDLENLIPFDEKFLSGFRAESYKVELKDGFSEAQTIMEPPIRRLIKSDIGGDHQRISTVNTSYSNISFKHILLPVWISAYRFKDKVYRFMINARTGEVKGERPYSVGKILLAILAALIIIGGIAFAVWYFNQEEVVATQS